MRKGVSDPIRTIQPTMPDTGYSLAQKQQQFYLCAVDLSFKRIYGAHRCFCFAREICLTC